MTENVKSKECISQANQITLITPLRIPYLGRIGNTKLVLPKWHKYGILDRVIRVSRQNPWSKDVLPWIMGLTNLVQ